MTCSITSNASLVAARTYFVNDEDAEASRKGRPVSSAHVVADSGNLCLPGDRREAPVDILRRMLAG